MEHVALHPLVVPLICLGVFGAGRAFYHFTTDVQPTMPRRQAAVLSLLAAVPVGTLSLGRSLGNAALDGLEWGLDKLAAHPRRSALVLAALCVLSLPLSLPSLVQRTVFWDILGYAAIVVALLTMFMAFVVKR